LSDSRIPDFVVVGHICQDLLPDGSLSLGGSVSYAATTAHRMGCRVGIVTSAASSLDLSPVLPDADIRCKPATSTTIFENIYRNGKRQQILHQRAEVLTCEEIPAAWRLAPMVYLGSIDQEIDPRVFSCFSDESLVCVMPQGFFRRWDEQGHISFVEWRPPATVLRHIDILVLSELDVPDPEALVRDWRRAIDVIVITRAERGATVYQAEEVCHYPARPAEQVDPTGAGDVFAAAFLIRFQETGDLCQSARFANAVASFSIEGPGVSSIPQREQAEAYLRMATW
jgi:1D-myo-inositol 3-kinase